MNKKHLAAAAAGLVIICSAFVTKSNNKPSFILTRDNPAVQSTIATEDIAPASSLININTASAGELCNLPGIGESLSQRIIDYRTQNGAFGTIEEIQKVSGIGEKKFEAMRSMITVN